MPDANYYREQARLLARWSRVVRSPDMADRLMQRARQMAALADRPDHSLPAAAPEQPRGPRPQRLRPR